MFHELGGTPFASQAGAVDWTDVEAVNGNDVVVATVVAGANVRAIGGSDMVRRGNDAIDEVACSMSMRGASSNGTLKTSFGGFFKASKHFCTSASRCNGLI
uniref:Uncharacterized protein n=1 Tax=Romanomermis culicivorax TaxID=13658 RepID=A0A915KIZ0_ROMCU